MVEQTCIYQDIDNKDIKSGVHHLLVYEHDALIGYARLLPAGLSYDTPSIGRILTSSGARGKGIGKKVIALAIQHCAQLWPEQAITIGAQSHLRKLYQGYGFKEVSDSYLEDGIPHVDMCAKASDYHVFKDYL
ncbi:GNAT family N-acetyltransferase [Ningiella sp. W23]|uniref:GNAT family N-acetyltransferase n=1 Tax=Ningiella sp. W23 TaxID=3023715 RepID=UPI0037579F6D